MNFAESWKGIRNFIVDQRVAESSVIDSFYLKPKDGKPLAKFKPGQFLTYELDIPGQSQTVIRTYTLSDCPHPEYYRASIKREPSPKDLPDVPSGLGSNYFHDFVHAGSELKVKAPRGDFFLNTEADTPVVLLSGGVGQTPMISMLNSIVQSDSQRETWFIHGALNSKVHAFGNHVRKLTVKRSQLHSHFVYSDPLSEDIQGEDFDSTGYLSMSLLERLFGHNEFEFYVCGPPAFMKIIYNGLLDWGVPDSRIHYEFFGPASVLKEGNESVQSQVENQGAIEVMFAGSGVKATWDPSFSSLLDFAEAQGVNPAFGCRSGMCHSCLCKIIKGEIEYNDGPQALSEPDDILICCSKPRTNVVIAI
jgi:hypothetical protein